MQTEKGQPAFENIDDILAEKIIDHTKASADTNAQEKPDATDENRSSKPVFCLSKKISVLLLMSVIFIIFLLIKKTSSRT